MTFNDIMLTFTGRNVALRQPTNQTSDFHDPDFASVNFPSHLAVDGNKASDFHDMSCSITDPASLIKGSWSLFYRRLQFLYSIDVYSRKSGILPLKAIFLTPLHIMLISALENILKNFVELLSQESLIK